MASVLASFSQELSAAAEKAGPSVVTVHARHRVPSSGIHWRRGIVVTANHTVRREDDITVLVHGGKRVSAKLAGRDPGTDLAVLKFDQETDVPIPQFADTANLKLANFILALGRTRFGNLVASAGIIGGLGGEWRTWRGGRIDQNIRLDLALYPGFSGGSLVNVEGSVLGLNTNGFGRGRAVTIPVSTDQSSRRRTARQGLHRPPVSRNRHAAGCRSRSAARQAEVVRGRRPYGSPCRSRRSRRQSRNRSRRCDRRITRQASLGHRPYSGFAGGREGQREDRDHRNPRRRTSRAVDYFGRTSREVELILK